jgi:PPP family 3-phenylpropionic acid transporter
MIYITSLFYLFYFSIIGIYIIFLPKVLADIGYNALEIGIIFSAAPLVRFLIPLLFIRGFKLGNQSFYTALVILFFSVILFYFSLYDFYMLLVSNILFGIGLSLVLPYVELISLQEVGKERYGKSRLFGSLGFMGTALILVKHLSSADVALNYLLILTFATVLFAFLVVKNTSSKEEETKSHTHHLSVLKDYKLWVGFIFMQIGFGAFYNFYTIYETSYGISMDMTVYLWSFGVIIEIIMLYFQGGLLQKNLLNIIRFTILATAIRWLLVFLYPQNLYIMFFAQSIHALSFALFHSASISFLFHLYKNKPLAQQMFSGLSYGLGSLLGALISGYIYQYLPKYLFLSSFFFALIAFFSISSFSKTHIQKRYLD